MHTVLFAQSTLSPLTVMFVISLISIFHVAEDGKLRELVSLLQQHKHSAKETKHAGSASLSHLLA